MQKSINYKSTYNGLIVALVILPTTAFGFSADTDIHDVLLNMRNIIGPFISLIMMISYLFGIGMVYKGLMMLKVFSQPLTQQTRPGEISGPLVYICVGTALIWLPTTSDAISFSFLAEQRSNIFSGENINLDTSGAATQLLSYSSYTTDPNWDDIINTIVLYIQFIGLIAFVRGFFIMSHAGQPGVQPGSISKGVVHIIGGTLSINFLPFVDVLNNTLFSS